MTNTPDSGDTAASAGHGTHHAPGRSTMGTISAMPAGDPRRPSRNGKGRFTRDLAHAERDGRACLLISQGHTYEEVARELGYTDKDIPGA